MNIKLCKNCNGVIPKYKAEVKYRYFCEKKECRDKEFAMWDQRVKDEECIECGKVLTLYDKEYDQHPRKLCASCLSQKRVTLQNILKEIDKLKGK
tara:strand:- start:8484 stop:8768 length:285 start_codon:yes stop_codon:yes gene_type:complete